ncbi:two-component system response regulator [Alphaproteobacteria bacterium 46_93_T64]|nr:two-component system response regulator [Alphaproteobacteria bacterium 46_93_T64]
MDNSVKLLLVEDDEIDVMGIRRALKSMKIVNSLCIARDGIEALEYLRGENGKEKLEQPYIILLDLNMPRMGGLEFLEEVRKDEKLQKSTIFVMTTSSDEKDICAAYDKNIAGYIVKSKAEETFLEAINMIGHYWKIVEFPQQ